MQKILSVLLSNRFKSFYWRSGAMFLAGVLELIVQSLTEFNVPTQATVLVGLMLGEVSKYLKKKYDGSLQ